MRKVVLFQTLLALVQVAIVAQPSVPYTTSSVQGSSIITNYYDPNTSGTAAGPGLPISPLQDRLSGPLLRTADPTSLTSSGAQTFSSVNTVPAVTTAPGLINTPAMTNVPTTSSYSSSFPQPTTGYIQPTNGYIQPASNQVVPVNEFPRSVPNPSINGAPMGGMGGAPFRRDSLVPINFPAREGFGSPDEPTYLFPGLVRFSLDKWVGSDYLYNLPPNIGVVVEVVYPTGFSQRIDTNLIKQNIQGIFSYAGISPVSETFGGDAPLPFFHLVIFVCPVEDNYVFSVTGRLFESVRLSRLNVRLPGSSQAITWEKQELVVSSRAFFFDQLMATSKEIAQLFTQRVMYFRRQILEQEDQLRIQCGPRVTSDPFAPRKMTEAELQQSGNPCPCPCR